MTTETEGYLERLDYLRNEFKKEIRDMSPEELAWQPLDADTNSAYVLATHVAGTEAYHIHQLVGGIDVNRNREAEFATGGTDPSHLESILNETGDTTREVLSNATTADLDETFDYRGQSVTRRWAVLHTLEHIGQHLGHLTLTRQLYRAQNG